MFRAMAATLIVACISGGCTEGMKSDVEAQGSAIEEGGTAEPTSRFFEANGLRLNYVDWGNVGAPPMILLHHVNSQSRTWDRFARQVRGKYHVVALDMRGHGDSEWAGAGQYTTEDYAKDVAALVSHLELDRTILLGGSTGGRVALVYAALHPERVSALVMEDVGAVRPPSIASNFAERLAAGDPEFDTIEEWAAHLRGRNQRTPAEVFQHLAQHSTRRLPSGKLVLKRDPAILMDMQPLELWEYVEKIRAPLLLVLGSESTIVGEDQQIRFRQIQPDIEIVVVPGAGHIVVHDKPDEFERVVHSFLTLHGL